MKTLFKRLSLENQNAILLKQIELPATWTPIYAYWLEHLLGAK